jgi:hypothetical protein
MLYLILKHFFQVESMNRDNDVIQIAWNPFMWSVLEHTLETMACFHLMTRCSDVNFRTKPSAQINTEVIKRIHTMQNISGQGSIN